MLISLACIILKLRSQTKSAATGNSLHMSDSSNMDSVSQNTKRSCRIWQTIQSMRIKACRS